MDEVEVTARHDVLCPLCQSQFEREVTPIRYDQQILLSVEFLNASPMT